MCYNRQDGCGSELRKRIRGEVDGEKASLEGSQWSLFLHLT